MQALYIPPDHFRELRPEEIFPGSERPLEVELGCGDGTFLAAMATEHPERDFLGVERMRSRVASTARKIQAQQLGNARVMRLESAYTVAWLLPTASVSRLHLLCPDPWPKIKHEARRLVNQEEFLNGLERILNAGGEFMLKTDDAVYFGDAMNSLSSRTAFEELEWPQSLCYYPTTDFEKQWLALERTIYRGRWRKR